MSFFSRELLGDECGVVIDIGSGSVGVAIVVSLNIEEKVEVVWNYREYVIIRDVFEISESLRDINTALVNALLELGSSGMKALASYDPKMKVGIVQTALCAPWAYTVTKTITYEDEHPFEITNDLVRELMKAAQDQIKSSIADGEIYDELGLRLITEDTLNVQVNGYTIKNPIGQEGRVLALSHISAVAKEKVLATLDDGLDKILPKAEREYYSFMYLYYRTLDNLHPDTSEICTIDVTNEATEIGIVRDGILKHTSYIPFGMYSLAREIAAVCDIPKEEAYTYLKNGRDITDGAFSKEKTEEIREVYEAYEERITELFKQTGDALSIPKTLFLHTSKETEEFFRERVTQSAKKATASNHTVHLFTSELLTNITLDDTALAMSAATFHMRERFSK